MLFADIYGVERLFNQKFELPFDGIIYHIWSTSQNVQERLSIVRILTSEKPCKGR
jgi:uncharacterized protein YabE (DUF348 family)